MRVVEDVRGQATVELLAIAPVAGAVALALAQLLAAGAASEVAGQAAQAGAMAILQGRDPSAEARHAAPDWAKSRIAVDIDGRVVRVRLKPRVLVPGLADVLTADETADAGPRA